MERKNSLHPPFWHKTLMFGILKSKVVEALLSGILSWEDIAQFFQTKDLHIVSWMQPVYFTGRFWRNHYQGTIEMKEQLEKGSGSKYLDKILKRLENSYGIPIILHTRSKRLCKADNLREAKAGLRLDLLRLLNLPESCKSSLIHISDDAKTAKSELANLQHYLSVSPASLDYHECPVGDDQLDLSSSMLSDLSPRLTSRSWADLMDIPHEILDEIENEDDTL
eukprot:TRINITY_DN222_c0_g1_i10.p1 TRINITY_DN222_c0_g1~~TRINITY_DN222_c0_g1_i10.p1  ORF type:complete len:223 (-),score=44.45 TRINITY_DN222_c0_g1_i10:1840-2508(-)